MKTVLTVSVEGLNILLQYDEKSPLLDEAIAAIVQLAEERKVAPRPPMQVVYEGPVPPPVVYYGGAG